MLLASLAEMTVRSQRPMAPESSKTGRIPAHRKKRLELGEQVGNLSVIGPYELAEVREILRGELTHHDDFAQPEHRWGASFDHSLADSA